MIKIPKILEINCRILGIIQYDTLEIGNKNRLNKALSIFFPLPVLVLFLYILFNSLQSDERLKYSYVLVIFSNWANYLVKYVWYLLKRNKVKQLLFDFNEFEINASKTLGNTVCEKKGRIFFFIAFFVYIVLVNRILGHNSVHTGKFWDYTISNASNIFEFLFHSALLSRILPIFKAINKKFKKYKMALEMENSYPSNHKLEEINSLEHLSNYHCDLARIVMVANDLLTLPFLLTFSAYLATLIDVSYELVLCFSREDIDVNFLVNYFNWITFSILNLVMEIQIWNSTALEANKTSSHIHTIWNIYAKNKMVDSDVNHLKLISTRLLNTKLHITALGFFKIDWALLHMVAATLTTYLIILIQLGH